MYPWHANEGVFLVFMMYIKYLIPWTLTGEVVNLQVIRKHLGMWLKLDTLQTIASIEGPVNILHYIDKLEASQHELY